MKNNVREYVATIKSYGCIICGSMNNLTFHHKDPKDKIMDISTMASKGKSLGIVSREIVKCICVCRKCHDKIHKPFLIKHKDLHIYEQYISPLDKARSLKILKKKEAMDAFKEMMGVYEILPILKKE